MKFVDEAIIEVKAGSGGNGAVSFRREKYVPLGGPDGGDGGKGGDIVFLASDNINTLYDVRYKQKISAPNGEKGDGRNCYGRGGADEIILVPVGTLIYDAETNELIADLTHNNQKKIVARGGDGGQGNSKFKTSINKAPRYAGAGWPGQQRRVRLELKLIADVGILGFPSVGKSTFISIVSNAKPKIADYHFTTLIPNLGMVELENYTQYVIADIPGLIEGASQGLGLGHRFLRHVERTKFLIHMFEITPGRKSPVDDIKKLNKELALYSDDLPKREQIFVLNKSEMYTEEDSEQMKELQKYLKGKPFFKISCATHKGISELMTFINKKVIEYRQKDSR